MDTAVGLYDENQVASVSNLELVIIKLISMRDSVSTSCEITLEWMKAK